MDTVVVAVFRPFAAVAVAAFPVRAPVKVVAVILPVPVIVGEVRERPDKVEDQVAAVEEEATRI
jgi:hypothetical protein